MELNESFDEIKFEYLFSMKKAIVDFVLSDPLNKQVKKIELTPARLEAKSIFNKWRHRWVLLRVVCEKHWCFTRETPVNQTHPNANVQ